MNVITECETKQKVIKIPANVYSRCCGYFSPVHFGDKAGTWNLGKREEFHERKMINIEAFKK